MMCLPPTVVVIDDEFGARSALEAILGGQYSVKLFARGTEAINFLRSGRDLADVVFIDYTMPDLDGPTVCRSITLIDPTLSLIGITGNVGADFCMPLFAVIEKRGTAVEKVREIASKAVALTCCSRQKRDSTQLNLSL